MSFKKMMKVKLLPALVTLIINSCSSFSFEEKEKYYYNYSKESLRIFELKSDSISLFNIQDSIYTKNIAHINTIKKVSNSNNNYIILNKKKIILTPFEYSQIKNINRVQNSYWINSEDIASDIFKFILSMNETFFYEYIKESNTFRKPVFYSTHHKRFFDKFDLIEIYGFKNYRFFITGLDERNLRVLDLNSRKNEVKFQKYNIPDINITGSWELKNKLNSSETGLCEDFKLFKNSEGVLTSGYYKNESFYYFSGIQGKKIYFMLRNKAFFNKTIRFNLDRNQPLTLSSDEISEYQTYQYIKQE